MSGLPPFISYFGSKSRISKIYPEPLHPTIVEPFAGSACYSLLYPDKNVELYDLDENICVLWDYLIDVPEGEIRGLPELEKGEEVPRGLSEGARMLIGFWTGRARNWPGQTMSSGRWGRKIKERVASQLQYIRHWKIKNQSYSECHNDKATWFVDPPYVKGGEHYRKSNKGIDYKELGQWCQSRNGQLIVCENGDADWLPFQYLGQTNGVAKRSTEVVYTQNCFRQQSLWGDL